jgi:hypothetical protein
MERSIVFTFIDGEREYQERRWPGHKHTVTEYAVYIRDYAEEILHLNSRNDEAKTDGRVKDAMRKIGALAVACMEENGALPRISRIPADVIGNL